MVQRRAQAQWAQQAPRVHVDPNGGASNTGGANANGGASHTGGTNAFWVLGNGRSWQAKSIAWSITPTVSVLTFANHQAAIAIGREA